MSEERKVAAGDAEIADLLREAGPRIEPPAQMMAEVGAAVRAEWLDVVAERRRHRSAIWAVAASLCVIAIGTLFSLRFAGLEPEPMATLERAEGEVFVTASGHPRAAVHAGQRIQTGDAVRSVAAAAVTLDNGISLRLDRDTSVQLRAGDRIELTAGAVYVDTGARGSGAPLTIDTHAGAVQHLGTQYLVRARIDGIDVSVREGRVTIENQAGRSEARAGERLSISMQGSIEREPIAATDPTWRWASDIAPAFAIENASLASFLDWVARETGRELVYESERARTAAGNEILHGSIARLSPETALTAVLMGTPLRHRAGEPEILSIGLEQSTDP